MDELEVGAPGLEIDRVPQITAGRLRQLEDFLAEVSQFRGAVLEVESDPDEHSARESFQIKLRSHRNEPVEIRVREHLFRWSNWEMSDPFVQKDANTIEFNVPIKPGEEHVVSYTVRYTKLPRAQAGQ